MDKIVVGGIFAVLATAFGVLIKAWTKRSSRKQEAKAELRSIVDSIVLVQSIDLSYLNLKLKRLREFFLKHERLRGKNKEFFGKWLPETLESAQPGTGGPWKHEEERLGELIKALGQLRETNCP